MYYEQQTYFSDPAELFFFFAITEESYACSGIFVARVTVLTDSYCTGPKFYVVERKFELYEFKIIVGKCIATSRPPDVAPVVLRFNYEANDAAEYTCGPIKFRCSGEKAGV